MEERMKILVLKGIIEGRGCGTLKMTSESKYPELAYELGKSL